MRQKWKWVWSRLADLSLIHWLTGLFPQSWIGWLVVTSLTAGVSLWSFLEGLPRSLIFLLTLAAFVIFLNLFEQFSGYWPIRLISKRERTTGESMGNTPTVDRSPSPLIDEYPRKPALRWRRFSDADIPERLRGSARHTWVRLNSGMLSQSGAIAVDFPAEVDFLTNVPVSIDHEKCISVEEVRSTKKDITNVDARVLDLYNKGRALLAAFINSATVDKLEVLTSAMTEWTGEVERTINSNYGKECTRLVSGGISGTTRERAERVLARLLKIIQRVPRYRNVQQSALMLKKGDSVKPGHEAFKDSFDHLELQSLLNAGAVVAASQDLSGLEGQMLGDHSGGKGQCEVELNWDVRSGQSVVVWPMPRGTSHVRNVRIGLKAVRRWSTHDGAFYEEDPAFGVRWLSRMIPLLRAGETPSEAYPVARVDKKRCVLGGINSPRYDVTQHGIYKVTVIVQANSKSQEMENYFKWTKDNGLEITTDPRKQWHEGSPARGEAYIGSVFRRSDGGERVEERRRVEGKAGSDLVNSVRSGFSRVWCCKTGIS